MTMIYCMCNGNGIFIFIFWRKGNGTYHVLNAYLYYVVFIFDVNQVSPRVAAEINLSSIVNSNEWQTWYFFFKNVYNISIIIRESIQSSTLIKKISGTNMTSFVGARSIKLVCPSIEFQLKFINWDDNRSIHAYKYFTLTWFNYSSLVVCVWRFRKPSIWELILFDKVISGGKLWNAFSSSILFLLCKTID